MTSIRSKFVQRENVAVYMLSLLFLIIEAAMFLFAPMEVVFEFAADDIFYYHILAENTLSGEGVVFNQNIPTNGFHPLYFIFVLAIRGITIAIPANPLFLNLWINIMLHTLVGLIIYKIGLETTNKKTALVMSSIWILNPAILGQTLSGMEPILQVLFVSILTHFHIVNDLAYPIFKKGIILGILIGLIFLSRMDGLFIGLGIGFALITRRYNSIKDVAIFDLAHRNHIIDAAVSIIISLPWLLYSFMSTGYVFPISGKAIRLVELSEGGRYVLPIYLFEPLNTFKEIYSSFVHYLTLGISPIVLDPVGSLGLGFGSADKIIVYGFMILLLTAVVIYVLYTVYNQDRFKLLSRIDFLIFSQLFILSFYVFYQYRYRNYYSLSLYFTITLLIGFVIYILSKRKNRSHQNHLTQRVIIVSVVLVFIASQSFIFISFANTDSKPGLYMGAKYVENELPEEAKVGSFNTGYIQYYTPSRDIINLDGVINTQAYKTMENGRLDCYIRSENINYLAGPNTSFKHTLENNNEYSKGSIRLKQIRNGNGYTIHRIVTTNKNACQVSEVRATSLRLS